MHGYVDIEVPTYIWEFTGVSKLKCSTNIANIFLHFEEETYIISYI
jgi:hypothetical protein